jgi:hypothetical protein
VAALEVTNQFHTFAIEANMIESAATPRLNIFLKPTSKKIFKVSALPNSGATRSIMNHDVAMKNGAKLVPDKSIGLTAANKLQIACTETAKLQVMCKNRSMHTINFIVSKEEKQVIVGWQDLKAISVLGHNFPAMEEETDAADNIVASVEEEEDNKLGELREKLIGKFSSVFSDKVNKTPMKGEPMLIQLRDNIEISPHQCYTARATPIHQHEKANLLELEVEEREIIERVTKPTPWTSPGFFVPKANGGLCLATDF